VTLFDFIAVLILAVSAIIGFVRGGTREVMTVLAFILAVLISIFALRFTGPIFRQSIETNWIANALAIIVVFIAAFILIRVIGYALTRRIHNTHALGTLDRLVGVGFGMVRAFVLLGVFYMVFNAATPPERVPAWIKDATLYPLASFSAKALMALAPQGSAVAGRVAPALEDAVRDGASEGKGQAAKGPGYDQQSRDEVDALVEQNR
jgi:membrane protein required for colicin V production